MTVACSDILPGGGTNQELVLHCLHEAKGNILVSKQSSVYLLTPTNKAIHAYMCVCVYFYLMS